MALQSNKTRAVISYYTVINLLASKKCKTLKAHKMMIRHCIRNIITLHLSSYVPLKNILLSGAFVLTHYCLKLFSGQILRYLYSIA